MINFSNRLNSHAHLAEILHEITARIPRPDGSELPHWMFLTERQRELATDAVRELLEGPPLTAEQAHDLWMGPYIEQGWTKGDYCQTSKTHPCICPFDELTDVSRVEEIEYAIVREGHVVTAHIRQAKWMYETSSGDVLFICDGVHGEVGICVKAGYIGHAHTVKPGEPLWLSDLVEASKE